MKLYVEAPDRGRCTKKLLVDGERVRCTDTNGHAGHCTWGFAALDMWRDRALRIMGWH